MGVSKEARDLAEQVLGEMALGNERRAYDVIQSLIDDTLERAAAGMENLCFFTDVNKLMAMTKQEMSARTCHEGAKAIRAMKGKAHD